MEALKPIVIILLGRTRVGKSYLGNKLANKEYFDVSADNESCTKLPKLGKFSLFDKEVIIIDTPGFGDNTGISGTDILKNIISLMKHIRNGFTLGLFCVSALIKPDDYLDKELRKIQDIFGKEAFQNIFYTFTQANKITQYQDKKDFEKNKNSMAKFLKDKGFIKLSKNEILDANTDNFEEFLDRVANLSSEKDNFRPLLTKFDLQSSEGIKQNLETLSPFFKYLKDEIQKEVDELQYKINDHEEEEESISNILKTVKSTSGPNNNKSKIDEFEKEKNEIINLIKNKRESLEDKKKELKKLECYLKENSNGFFLFKSLHSALTFEENLKKYFYSTDVQPNLKDDVASIVQVIDIQDDSIRIIKGNYEEYLKREFNERLPILLNQMIEMQIKNEIGHMNLPIIGTLLYIWRPDILEFILKGIASALVFKYKEIFWTRKTLCQEISNQIYNHILKEKTFDELISDSKKKYENYWENILMEETISIIISENDSLEKISEKFSVSISEIKQHNPQITNHLLVGTELRIPKRRN